MGQSRDQHFPPANLHRIRPDQKILRRGAAAVIAFLVPSTVILYVLTVPRGPWPWVLATELIVVAGLIVTIVKVRLSGFWVGRSGIAERGFFGRTQFVPVEKIDSILLVETFERDGVDTLPQLFLCDEKGKQLIRMRGQFWSREAMMLVSETLEIPTKEITDPVTTEELLEEYPGLFYWFERHPRLLAVFFTVGVIVGGTLLYAAVTLIELQGQSH